MIIDTLITDRTAADVAALTVKGHYNASDLNRVGEAQAYIASRFQQYGYAAAISPKTDWTIRDIPRQADTDTYLRDLQTLRDVFATLSTTPEVPGSMAKLGYQEANDIERILMDINTVIERVFKSFVRSGAFTFRSGARALPCAESDPGRTIDDIDVLGLNVDDLDAHGTDFYTLMYGVLK